MRACPPPPRSPFTPAGALSRVCAASRSTGSRICIVCDVCAAPLPQSMLLQPQECSLWACCSWCSLQTCFWRVFNASGASVHIHTTLTRHMNGISRLFAPKSGCSCATRLHALTITHRGRPLQQRSGPFEHQSVHMCTILRMTSLSMTHLHV